MRTTLDLDDDVIAAAQAIVDAARARRQRQSLGAAVSLLAHRGMRAVAPPLMRPDGFPVLTGPDPTHVITDDLVKAHQDD